MDATMYNNEPLANIDNGTCIPFVNVCNNRKTLNNKPLAHAVYKYCRALDIC